MVTPLLAPAATAVELELILNAINARKTPTELRPKPNKTRRLLSRENWFPCGSKATSREQEIFIYGNFLRELARGVSTNMRETCEWGLQPGSAERQELTVRCESRFASFRLIRGWRWIWRSRQAAISAQVQFPGFTSARGEIR